VVTGKIYFLLVRIRIKHMELAILRRESAGTGLCSACCILRAVGFDHPSRFHFLPVVTGILSFGVVGMAASNVYHETDTLTKFEVMDGAPVRGESVPIRLYLAGFDLTPTYRNVSNMFTVRYYLNLVIVDEEDRRYFKYVLQPDLCTSWSGVSVLYFVLTSHTRTHRHTHLVAR
jgi:vacuolar protein sorting-associated protein 26